MQERYEHNLINGRKHNRRRNFDAIDQSKNYQRPCCQVITDGVQGEAALILCRLKFGEVVANMTILMK